MSPTGLAEQFRRLHARGGDVLVLPNAWDAGSARVIVEAGARAVATTSSGASWSLGRPDGEGLSRDEMLAVVRRVARAVSVPVTADVERGYGDGSPRAVAETVRAVLDAGAVGMNLEDGEGPGAVTDLAAQTARVAAARDAADVAGVPLFLNARVDLFLFAVGDPAARFDETVRRAHAYVGAGADGIFVPGVADADTIRRLAAAIDAPLNVIARPGIPSIAELRALGVARASLGGGVARGPRRGLARGHGGAPRRHVRRPRRRRADRRPERAVRAALGTMDTSFDLDAYLARVGHAGDRAPTLDTLRAVHLAHAQRIPFENLDPLLRRPVPLDADALQAKLVRGGRGGWCFEHNHLLLHALRTLGFRATPLVARVLWNASVSVGSVTSRSHMLLLVHLPEGDYLADVGFGGLTLTAPLRLVPDVEQPTPHETFRLVPIEDGRELALQACVAGEWRPLYRFDLQPQHQLDYEVSSWYLCTNPRSSFLSNLMVGRPEPGGRRVLRNNVLTTHRAGAPSESRTLTTAGALREVLEGTFGIALPDSPDLEPTLERIAATPLPP